MKRRPKQDAPKESPSREMWLKGWERAHDDAFNNYSGVFSPMYGDEVYGDEEYLWEAELPPDARRPLWRSWRGWKKAVVVALCVALVAVVSNPPIDMHLDAISRHQDGGVRPAPAFEGEDWNTAVSQDVYRNYILWSETSVWGDKTIGAFFYVWVLD
jgi:hypothetical protein